jgi:hypothetical protein
MSSACATLRPTIAFSSKYVVKLLATWSFQLQQHQRARCKCIETVQMLPTRSDHACRQPVYRPTEEATMLCQFLQRGHRQIDREHVNKRACVHACVLCAVGTNGRHLVLTRKSVTISLTYNCIFSGLVVAPGPHIICLHHLPNSW